MYVSSWGCIKVSEQNMALTGKISIIASLYAVVEMAWCMACHTPPPSGPYQTLAGFIGLSLNSAHLVCQKPCKE